MIMTMIMNDYGSCVLSCLACTLLAFDKRGAMWNCGIRYKFKVVSDSTD